MSKHIYNRIGIWKLVLIAIMLLAAVVCQAAEIHQDQKLGRENPFEIAKPSAPQEQVIVEVVKNNGITQAQLQEAIKAALESIPRPDADIRLASQAVVIEPAPVEVIPEKCIKSMMLKFLRAENILPVVNSMLTSNGTASIDRETNTLIVCDSKERVLKVFQEVGKADRTPQQVLIEVVIIDVQLSDDKELGVNWGNLFQLNGGLGSVSYVQELTNLNVGGTLTLINGRIKNTVKALQKHRNTEILASPKVLVLSGQEAFFETIEEIAYTDLTQTGAGGGLNGSPITSTKFKNAGITLKVKPTITDDGRIMIEVEPDQSINTGVSVIGGSNVPNIDRRRIKTTLLMSEGEVAVIGGMRSKDVRISNDKIPILGDIPYIGGLFSNKKRVVENRELLIIISPHIQSANNSQTARKNEVWHKAKALVPMVMSTDVSTVEEELASSLAILRKVRKK